jgi:hypothetical protein
MRVISVTTFIFSVFFSQEAAGLQPFCFFLLQICTAVSAVQDGEQAAPVQRGKEVGVKWDGPWITFN